MNIAATCAHADTKTDTSGELPINTMSSFWRGRYNGLLLASFTPKSCQKRNKELFAIQQTDILETEAFNANETEKKTPEAVDLLRNCFCE